jgi:hypothetical protein
VFLDDILPARMAGAHLLTALRKLGINNIYTYDTPYNAAFLGCLPEEEHRKLTIQYIDSVKNIKDGYVVIPGTNAKALNMCDSPLARRTSNEFEPDPFLEKLIATKEIKKSALASFKTFGTSRFWGHENEVPSYREIILNEVSALDRWRGRAWILDGSKL